MLLNIDGGKRYSLPGEQSTNEARKDKPELASRERKSNVTGSFIDLKDRQAWAKLHDPDVPAKVNSAMDLFKRLDNLKKDKLLKEARKEQVKTNSKPFVKSDRQDHEQRNGKAERENAEIDNKNEGGSARKFVVLSKKAADEDGYGPEPEATEDRTVVDGDDSKMLNSLRRMFRLKMPSFVSTKKGDISSQKSFDDLGIHKLLHPFPQPTKIQERAIPHLLSQADYPVLMQAETGSGKTLAFVLPLVQKLLFTTQIVPADTIDFRSLGTLAVIIAPTRELAKQIHDVVERVIKIRKWGSVDTPHQKRHWLTSGLLCGTSLSTNDHGERPREEQEKQNGETPVAPDPRDKEDGKNPLFTRTKEKRILRKGIHILVCTPGRLLEHLQYTGSFKTSNLAQIIVDEADHTVNLGMSHWLKEAVQLLRARCSEAMKPSPRVILTSATIVSQMRYLVKSMVPASTADSLLFVDAESEKKVERGSSLAKMQLPKQLVQYKVDVRMKLRMVYALRVFNDITTKCMAFCLGCDMVNYLYALLIELQSRGLYKNTQVKRLHGRMTVSQREQEYQDFRDSEHQSTVLLCTDVAARGLDMPGDVGLVVHVDPPQTMEDYVHRIGRTARCGNAGTSLLFAPIPTFLQDREDIRDFKFLYQDQSLFARRGLEGIVDESHDLQLLAVKAFQTWIHSLGRVSGVMKELHLGHACASFGISATPKDVLDPEICRKISHAAISSRGHAVPGEVKRKWNERQEWKNKKRRTY